MTLPIDRFAELALACVHREYPNKIAHSLERDEDVRPPRELTPAFYGCFDWHSAVHGHWLLAVAAERARDPDVAARAAAALSASLTPKKIDREVAYLAPRPTFERPYGLAWLCALHEALVTTRAPALAGKADVLAPLVDVAALHLTRWLPKLSRPTRSGVHSQTAFSLGLVLDWARATGHEHEATLVEARARAFYLDDRAYAAHLEPDGEDFLSPSLGAADLMQRILAPEELAAWLDRTLPELGRSEQSWLEPAVVTDPTDGRLAHLDGLNLSRAWMLRALARALPSGDPRIPELRRIADRHAEQGLRSVTSEHYEGSHWLGTFATYLAVRDARTEQ